MSFSSEVLKDISISTAADFRCGTPTSVATNTTEAVNECLASLGFEMVDSATWILAIYTEAHGPVQITESMKSTGKDGCFHGGSSCRSIMNEERLWGNNFPAFWVFVIFDPDGDYGVGGAEIGDSPREAAIIAIEQALENSGRPDETPSLIWISSVPGLEEDLLRGIADVVGERSPLLVEVQRTTPLPENGPRLLAKTLMKTEWL